MAVAGFSPRATPGNSASVYDIVKVHIHLFQGPESSGGNGFFSF